MKKIKITNKHIAIEVPEDAINFEISENGCFSYKVVVDEYKSRHTITSGFNNAKIIGVTPLSEEQWKEIVDKLTERSMSMTILKGYKNYDCSKKYYDSNIGGYSTYPFLKATQSFNSLMRSHSLTDKKVVIIEMKR